MQPSSLWADFSKSDKNLFVVLFLSLFFCGFSLLILSVQGPQKAFGWDVISELEQVPTLIDTYASNDLRFNISAYGYVVKEYFWAGGMPILTLERLVTLTLLVLGLLFLLTGLTTLQRNYFLAGGGIFTLLLVSFQVVVAKIPVQNGGFWVMFLVYLGSAFWINTFKQQWAINKRFLVFLFETFLLVILFYFLADDPTVTISGMLAFGMVSFLILSCIFIFIVAHQIVHALLWIITRKAQQGQNLMPKFMLLSLVYLLNLMLLYFKTSKTFGSWEGFFITPSMLLVASVAVGFVFFRQWCGVTNLLRFESSGAWLYGGMALITFVTMAYAYKSGNDALTEFFDDFVMYTHLSMGLCCMVHVLMNFIQPLQRGFQVHKVLYKPVFSKFTLARFFGGAAVIILFLLKNNFPLWQATAGYLNGIGDHHRILNDAAGAEKYYTNSLNLDPLNHHANYANGFIANLKGDTRTAAYFFKQATQRTGSEQAVVAESKFFVDNDKFFDAIFTLRDGLKKFPNSPHIMTNLAMLYDRAKLSDSTLYYLQQAKKEGSAPTFTSNLIAFWAKNGDEKQLSNIVNDLNDKVSNSAKANKALIQNRIFQPTTKQKHIALDSVLDVSQFAYLFNRNVNKTPADETDFEAWQMKAENSEFYNDLVFARANRAYYSNKKIKGLGLMSLLVKDEGTLPQLSKRTIGIWLLQEGVFERGLDFMKKSGDSASATLIEKQEMDGGLEGLQQRQAMAILEKAKNQEDFDKALIKAPLNPWVVSKAARFYSEKLHKDKEAYDFVLDALQINENAPELLKIHAILSVRLGLPDYADSSLLKLKAADYESFMPEFEREKALRNVEFK